MLFSFKRYLLATVLFWSSFHSTIAQEIITLPIEWGDYQKLTYFERSTIAPTIKGQQLDNGKPIVYWRKQLKSTNFTLNLLQSEFELAPEQDVKYLKEHAFNVYEELNVDLKVTNSGSEKWAVAYVFPYKMINGTIHRLTKLVMQLEPSASPVKPKDFVSNSVLQSGNGQWVKISVTEDGIYKINKSFLASCGISTDNLNPAHINIYGNGDGRLPELNSIPRTDDLAVNAIFIQGESDGSFDDNDYILFYGWGPNWVRTSSSAFDPSKNPYSDKSFYFININSNGTPIRIQNESSLAGIATQTVTSYDYRDDHEVDLVNLVQGGQRWYGELFDIELERTFSFSVPSIVTNEPVLFNTSIATNARSTAGTQQQYSVNGNVLLSSTLPAVSSDYVQSNQSLTWNTPSSAINFKIKITRSSPSTLVYLDKITLRGRRNLTFMSSQFNFRDTRSMGAGEVSKFTINSMPASGFVWDVTDRQNPNRILGSFNGTSYEFSLATDSLREFVASNGSSFYTPSFVGNVSPQNLHGLPQADYLIVTHPSFVGQANRLAQLHVSNGLSVHVVTTDQVFNEYSSGAQDATAFRMFAKQFYDRANNIDDQPKYLLLFGDGTYDPKNRVSNNNNYVLTY